MTSMLSRISLSRVALNASRLSRSPLWRGRKEKVLLDINSVASPRDVKKKEKPKGPVKNDDIPHRFVSFVDPDTGEIERDVPLREILRSMDRKKEVAHLVSEDPVPLVKIFSQSELDHAARAVKAKQRDARFAQRKKEVQITWGVTDRDFEHKLKKVRADLVRGVRVDVVFAPKAKTKAPEWAEMGKRMQEVFERLEDVAVEWNPRTLERRVGVLHLQRDPSKRVEEGEGKGEGEGEEKMEKGEDGA